MMYLSGSRLCGLWLPEKQALGVLEASLHSSSGFWANMLSCWVFQVLQGP